MFIKTDDDDNNNGEMNTNINAWHLFLYTFVISLFSLIWKFVGWVFGVDFSFFQALVLTMMCGIVFQLYHVLRFIIFCVYNLRKIVKSLEEIK